MSEISKERAGALIIDPTAKYCLMVHQKRSNLWGIPKGRKEYVDESNDVCMRREVLEEVGLDFTIIPHKIISIMSVYPKAKIYLIQLTDKRTIDTMSYTPPLENGLDNHEIDIIEWVPIYETVIRKTNSITRKALNRFMNQQDDLSRTENII